jgi:glycosyltransferase involved in cell wall biosynthesis
LAILNASAFIAPTDFAGTITKKIFRIHGKPIKIIHNGLPLDEFYNAHPEHFEKGLILYIGTIIRKKGVFELPEIFNKVRSQFPEARLVLIGSDSEDIATGSRSTWGLVKQKFYPSDLDGVSYLGKIPYSEVQEYIKKANVCVFPTYAETQGMVTIESMAMQKPVVNSNIGWAQELMEHAKSGFLVHPADHEVFAQHIVDVLKDEALYKLVGNEALRLVANRFDIQNVVEQNICFYKSLL